MSEEGVVEGYQEFIKEPEKKRRTIQCPQCDEMELEEVEKNSWLCHNCGFSVEDEEI